MRLSTRGRYGIRLLLDLALHGGEGSVLLKDIAQRQGISLSYLEHLIAPLIGGGILKSTRGPRGGISLLRHPEEIKLSEAIQLLEGPIAPVECVNNPEAYPRSDLCAIRDIWVEIKKATYGVLESTTLQDLVERQVEKEGTARVKTREGGCWPKQSPKSAEYLLDRGPFEDVPFDEIQRTSVLTKKLGGRL